ncbi:MAG: hypothetical protein QG665_345 [Patescibacteria group bacterium]|nr:hypothetical protein [Patescibacteria group bacterium]
MDNNLNSSPASPLASGPTTERKAWFIALGVIVLFLVLIFAAAIWSSKKFGSSEELSEADKIKILNRLEQDSMANSNLSETEKRAIIESLDDNSAGPSEAEKLNILKRLEQN